MELDAAWHVWYLIALAVLVDGVLAVSAQCGCCHHWLHYFLICPFIFLVPCVLAFCFILHMILHGFCLYIYFSLILHGVYILGIIGYVLVGGLILLFTYHHLCMYFLLSLLICIPSFFSSCYVVCTYFFFHICP